MRQANRWKSKRERTRKDEGVEKRVREAGRGTGERDRGRGERKEELA